MITRGGQKQQTIKIIILLKEKKNVLLNMPLYLDT